MARNIDWIAIEGEYRSGHRSLRQIADDYSVTEGAIRAKAKKGGWTRDPSGTKRAVVKAALAGFTQGSTQYAAREIIDREAEQDVADMNLGLDVARRSLVRLATMVEQVELPKDVKVIVEANKIAVETIRKIRGLDEQDEATKAADAVTAAAAAGISAADAYARMIGK